MFQKSAKQWYYLDFRKRIILFSGSRDISYEAIPANIAMNELLVKMGRDSLTFAEYKEYLSNNGITDAIYQFDGRSHTKVFQNEYDAICNAWLFLKDKRDRQLELF